MTEDLVTKAPDHLVALLVSNFPCPRPGPTGHPTPDQWARWVRHLADRIWSEAWHTGAAYGLSIQTPKVIIGPEVLADPSTGIGSLVARAMDVSTRDPS